MSEIPSSDDPLAVALWTAKERATWLVLCPQKCPLAAIFNLPGRGEVLCLPALTFLHKSMYRNPKDPDERGRYPAIVRELNLWSDDDEEDGRCRHGMWVYRPARIKSRLFGHRHGVPYTLADYVSTADSDESRRFFSDNGN